MRVGPNADDEPAFFADHGSSRSSWLGNRRYRASVTMASRATVQRLLLGSGGLILLCLTALLAVIFVMAWGGGVDLLPLLVIPAVASVGMLFVAAKTHR